MIKTSLLIESQLPGFIRDDENYRNFVHFLEAYYEFLEQKKGVVVETHKLLDYLDIDNTLDEFIDYFFNVFMPAFPKDVIADKRKLIRFSKELYESKGTEASYRFLFRSLYNVDSDVIETEPFVLRPSDGDWFLPKSIKIKTNDSRWINAENLWVFGNTSKSLAKIERVKLVNNRIEIFISDIERLFETGEFVRVVDRNLNGVYFSPEGEVLDERILKTTSVVGNGGVVRATFEEQLDIPYKIGSNITVTGIIPNAYNGKFKVVDIGSNYVIWESKENRTVTLQGNISRYITPDDGNILEAKLLGTISNVIIDRTKRGNYYLPGDPVVVYGGMDDERFGVGASAEVGEVTLGSIKSVRVDRGSWGYRENPNTFIYVTPDDGQVNLRVGDINPANVSNVTFIVKDSLELREDTPLHCNTQTGFVQIHTLPIIGQDGEVIDEDASNVPQYYFLRTNANSVVCNANTRLIDAFTFEAFPTYSIDTVIVENGGGGFRTIPKISAESIYDTDLRFGTAETYDSRFMQLPDGTPREYKVSSIKDYGILGPVLIGTDSTGKKLGGIGYRVGDEIEFIGGLGGGAYAKVNSVISGAINTVVYYTNTNNPSPLGGFGYSSQYLPKVSVATKPEVGSVTSGSDVLVFNTTSSVSNVSVGQTITGNGIPSNTVITEVLVPSKSIKLSNTATSTYSSNTYNFVGTGAVLYVDTVLGDSARLIPITDRIGSITTIKVKNYGEDYTSAPSISIKVQDIAVSNVNLRFLPERGDILYQGANSTTFTYRSYVDSVTRMTYDENSENSTYIIRAYNYNKPPNPNTDIILEKTRLTSPPNNFVLHIKTDYKFSLKTVTSTTAAVVGENGVLTYGDGSAKANSQFLNGLILGQGRYISEKGHISSYALLQNEDYNPYSYIISVEKEISKYRELLFKLLHPAGTKAIGQCLLKNETIFEYSHRETSVVRKIDEFEMMMAALATEPVSNNNFTSELMRFPEANVKYGTFRTNNSNILSISDFPIKVFVDQNVYSSGLPFGSTIQKIILSNNSILLSNNFTTTDSQAILLLKDNKNKVFITNPAYIFANTSNNSNIASVYTSANANISDIIKNQLVVSDAITIYANTTYNSNALVGVENTQNIIVGQEISGNNIPFGTRVAAVYSGNNTIIMSKKATGTFEGYRYSYLDRSTGERVFVYKYNYVQFNSIPSNTRVVSVSANNVILSKPCVKSNADILFYFVGDGVNNDSVVPSEFIKVEGKGLETPPKDYFEFNDLFDVENGIPLDVEDNDEDEENNVPLNATIYIRTS